MSVFGFSFLFLNSVYVPVSSKYGHPRNWAPQYPFLKNGYWGAYISVYMGMGVFIHDKNGYPSAEIGIPFYPSVVVKNTVSEYPIITDSY